MANMTDILALVRVAKIKTPGAPLTWLNNLLVAAHDVTGADGMALTGTSEAGGSVSFSMPSDMTPTAYKRLIEEAIQWLTTQPDPVNPNLSPRRIKRMRVSFLRAFNS